MKHHPKYQLKHISLRVPWHDKAWNGCVCDNPKANASCLILKTCSLKRNDALESSTGIRGQSIKNFSEAEYPACVSERGTMMADFSFDKKINHPYVESSLGTHGHLKETNLR